MQNAMDNTEQEVFDMEVFEIGGVVIISLKMKFTSVLLGSHPKLETSQEKYSLT
jgi:hypothetical protein